MPSIVGFSHTGKNGVLDFQEYVDMLAKISDLPFEEIEEILKYDMKNRNASNFEHYFIDVMIVLQKTHKHGHHDKKGNKKAVEEFVASIANLKKDSEGLLFNFDDNLAHILKGFTIDLRIFYNLLRKMITIKLNHDKIWTRQFYSEDLKLIYLIMKPLDSAFEARATVRRYNIRVKVIQKKLNWDSLIYCL